MLLFSGIRSAEPRSRLQYRGLSRSFPRGPQDQTTMMKDCQFDGSRLGLGMTCASFYPIFARVFQLPKPILEMRWQVPSIGSSVPISKLHFSSTLVRCTVDHRHRTLPRKTGLHSIGHGALVAVTVSIKQSSKAANQRMAAFYAYSTTVVFYYGTFRHWCRRSRKTRVCSFGRKEERTYRAPSGLSRSRISQ